MFLGGAMAACAWMPVAFASIFSKRLTKAGAFSGMLFGFLGCFVIKLYSSLNGIALPVYLDPSIVGIILNIIAMVIVSAMTRVTEGEKIQRESLYILPKEEKNPVEIEKTLKWTKLSTGIVGGL